MLEMKKEKSLGIFILSGWDLNNNISNVLIIWMFRNKLGFF